MTKPKVQIGDLVREMTDDEYAQYQKDQAVAEAAQQALNAQKIAKENALAKLGLTNEELSALLS